MNNKHYLLALNRMPKIGPLTVIKLLKRWPDLQELFSETSLQMERSGLPIWMARMFSAFDFHQIEADLRWAEAKNHHLLTWEDDHYPSLLKEIPDPPIVLYALGDLTCLSKPRLAMVGSRRPSRVGAETSRRFAFELAHHVTIVSGLALGIDAEAHRGCLAALGQTIAVMGTGIDVIYPEKHVSLAEKITQNGLLLSEFPLKSLPKAGHFPRRNRIISGLSLATMVVEAAIRSGSLITARLACEQNRDVLAIPGSIYNPVAGGCHYLLQQGAKLVTTPQDVLDELGLPHLNNVGEIPYSLDTRNQNLVQCIDFEVTSVDKIVSRSGLSVETVICDLADLEVQGMIKSVIGGYVRLGL